MDNTRVSAPVTVIEKNVMAAIAAVLALMFIPGVRVSLDVLAQWGAFLADLTEASVRAVAAAVRGLASLVGLA